MTPNGPSVFVYLFPALALAGVLLYFGYGAVDHAALPTQQASAVVTGKTFTPGGTTYHSTIVDGRNFTQADRYPDAHVVSLEMNGIQTGAAITPQLYDSLQAGDSVRVLFQRTRLSGRLLVTRVER